MTSNSSSPDVPPFYGIVETTVNALRLIHAARQGVIPRITRRLNDTERRTMIKSGAVFVFSVEESGIKRWTDGLLWSPSRIVGNFLVYREINERTSSRGSHKKSYPTEEPPSRAMVVLGSSPEQMSFAYKGLSQSGQSINDHGTFKSNGLIKKTITVTIDGSDLHLISYYTAEDMRSGKLKRPSCRADIMALNMPPHIFRLTNFRNPPKVEIGPDGKSRLVCEAEDLDAVDCKVEEPTYHVSESPNWTDSQGSQTSTMDGHFSGSSLYAIPNHNIISPNVYTREGVSDKWPMPLDNLRMPSSGRQEIPWSASPTHSSHVGSGRRGGNFGTGSLSPSDSWPSLHSHSRRWQGDSYESSTSNSGLHLDRSCLRLGNPYQSPIAMAHRRGENEMTSGFNSRYSGHVGENREIGSQRLPWLLTAEASEEDSANRNPHSGSSFTSSTSTSPHFPAHGYQHVPHPYSSTWSSSDTSALDLPSSQSPFKSSLQTYEASYSSRSGTMSSPEDYSNVEEYTDS